MLQNKPHTTQRTKRIIRPTRHFQSSQQYSYHQITKSNFKTTINQPSQRNQNRLKLTSHRYINTNQHQINNNNDNNTKQDLSTFPIANLPIINIQPFLHPITNESLPITLETTLNQEQQDIINQMSSALNHSGFFYISNSPLSKLIPSMQNVSQSFFNSPLLYKQQCKAINARRGWHYFQAAPNTISDYNDQIEAFTMQTPYQTDQQLISKYMSIDDSIISQQQQQLQSQQQNHFSKSNQYGNIQSIAGLNLPTGIYIDPSLLSEIQAELSTTSNDQQFNNNTFFHQNDHTNNNNDNYQQSQLSPNINHQEQLSNCDTNKWPQPLQSTTTPKSSSLLLSPTEFQSTYITYWNSCIQTCNAIMTILALILNIQPNDLIQLHQTGNHTLESKLYPQPSTNIILPRGANLVDEISSLSSQQQQQQSSSSSNKTNNNNTNILKNDSLDNVRIRFPIHSDMTTITLLTQTHENGGLMIKTNNGGWARVGKSTTDIIQSTLSNSIPINHNDDDIKINDNNKNNIINEPNILVNIGDFLHQLSGGKFQSSLHCVVNTLDINNTTTTINNNHTNETSSNSLNQPPSPPPPPPRISTVFFCIPDYDAIICDLSQSTNSNFKQPFIQPYEAGDRLPVML